MTIKLKSLFASALISLSVLGFNPITVEAEPSAIAALAEYLYEQGLFGFGFHSGPNQCRSLARYNSAINHINNANTEAGAIALQRFIGDSDMQRNCVNSIYRGDLGALEYRLGQAIEEYRNPPKINRRNQVALAIVNAYSNRCLDISSTPIHATQPGANLWQWDCNGSWPQIFVIENKGSDSLVSIKNPETNHCLDISSTPIDAMSQGANIIMYPCNNTWPQLFLMIKNSDNTVTFKNKESKMCLDVSSNPVPASQSQANIQQWNCNGSTPQKFTLR